MKKLLVLTCGLSLILFSCKESKKTTDSTADSQPKTESKMSQPVITFEKSPCFGTCPTYKAEIYENGTIDFTGTRFVKLVGNFKINIGEDWVKDTRKKAFEIGFMEMEEKYDGNVTDLPSTHTMINYKGTSKKVTARYNIPNELKDFNTSIHNDIMALIDKNAETLKKNQELRESRKRDIQKRPTNTIDRN